MYALSTTQGGLVVKRQKCYTPTIGSQSNFHKQYPPPTLPVIEQRICCLAKSSLRYDALLSYTPAGIIFFHSASFKEDVKTTLRFNLEPRHHSHFLVSYVVLLRYVIIISLTLYALLVVFSADCEGL